MEPNDFLEGLLEQAGKIQAQVQTIKDELANKTVDATVGGGMVTATVNAKGELLAIKIDPEAVDPEDVEMLQDLIVAAVNQGQRDAQQLLADEIAKITGGLGLGLPGLDLSSLM